MLVFVIKNCKGFLLFPYLSRLLVIEVIQATVNNCFSYAKIVGRGRSVSPGRFCYGTTTQSIETTHLSDEPLNRNRLMDFSDFLSRHSSYSSYREVKSVEERKTMVFNSDAGLKRSSSNIGDPVEKRKKKKKHVTLTRIPENGRTISIRSFLTSE